jgi:hypothetical protein|tara:strand:- start:189 stop:410 length:222 start_codon:yes stop_codon:yes gene_type:complete
MIHYQVIAMYRVGTSRQLTEKQAQELHTNPSVVMTLLNADQNLDRYVKVIVDGTVAGYQSYRAGRRVTLQDVS